MMWIGILLISMAVAFVWCIAALTGKGHKPWVLVATYITGTAIVYAFIAALVFGVMFLAQGVKAW